MFFSARSRPPGGSSNVTCFCSTTSGSQRTAIRASASASAGTRSTRRAVSTELVEKDKAFDQPSPIYSALVKTLAQVFAVALLLPLAACGSPAVPAAPAPTPSTVNLTGTWRGTGADPQGAETFEWRVTQTGDRLSGSAVMDSANRTDGSCGSCHKQKTGTITGTVTGGVLTLTLDFPAGGADITPLCGLTMNATTTDIAAGRIAAAYTGTTTCEGAITDGTLAVAR